MDITLVKLIDRIPSDIVALVVNIHKHPEIKTNSPEVKSMLPCADVVAVILSHVNGGTVSNATLDQAEAWITEQEMWQTRAMLVQGELQTKEPFTREHALAGNIPAWMGYPWATQLLYVWSEGLQKAVITAEEYAKAI